MRLKELEINTELVVILRKCIACNITLSLWNKIHNSIVNDELCDMYQPMIDYLFYDHEPAA